MSDSRPMSRRAGTATLAIVLTALVCSTWSCNRSKRRHAETPAPASTAAPAAESAAAVPAPAAVTTANAGSTALRGVAARIDRDHSVESPRSTSAVRLTWPPKGKRPSPVIYLGRSHLEVGPRRLLALRCDRDGRPCHAGELRGPVGRQRLNIPTDDLTPPKRGLTAGHGTIPALAAAASGWRDREALLLADRRVAWLAVHQAMRTLDMAGVQTRLAAVDVDGAVVDLAQEGPTEGQRAWGDRQAARGAAGGKDIPADLRSVEVQVDGRGAWMLLVGETGSPKRIRVDADRPSSLSQHARRILSAHPGLFGVSVIVDDDAPWSLVVAVIDALRDDCTSRPGRGRCKDPVRLFARVELSWTGDWLAPPTAAESAPSQGDPAAAAGGAVPAPRPLIPAPSRRGLPPARIAPHVPLDKPGRLGAPVPGSGARIPGVAH